MGWTLTFQGRGMQQSCAMHTHPKIHSPGKCQQFARREHDVLARERAVDPRWRFGLLSGHEKSARKYPDLFLPDAFAEKAGRGGQRVNARLCREPVANVFRRLQHPQQRRSIEHG